MQRRLGTVAFAVLLTALAPIAAAGDEGSVTAESVLFQGDTVVRLSEALALFSTSAPNAPVAFDLSADDARVRHSRMVMACPDTPGFPDACFPVDPRGESESYDIEDLVLTGSPSTTSPLYLSFRTDDASSVRARGPAELRVPQACSDDACARTTADDVLGEWTVSQPHWDVSADGAARVLIRGMNVQIAGVVDDEPFETSYNTGEFDEPADPSAGRPYRTHVVDVLEIVVEDADLEVKGESLGGLYGDLVAETEGPTQILGATGRFSAGGEEFDARGTNIAVPGELVVRPVAVSSGLLVLSLVDPVAPLAVPPADDVQFDSAVAGMAAGIGGAALGLFTLAWFWPYLKYVGTALMVVPMYSRIGREDVLEHGKREEIFGLIRDVPGIHAHEISSRAVIGWGTTVYHLKLLEDHGLIVGKRTGRYKRFFATAGGAARNVDHYAVLRNETTSAIAKHVLAHPGCIQKDLCAALNLAPSLVTWHMNRLEEVDLVKKVREGRTVRYYAGGSWGGLRMDFAPENVTATLVDAGAN